MITLQKTYDKMMETLVSYEEVDSCDVNRTFENKREAIKIISELKLDLMELKEITKVVKSQKNRKSQVLNLLLEDIQSINDISTTLGISNRNVSSILCYLKKDEYQITTSRLGGETYVELIQD